MHGFDWNDGGVSNQKFALLGLFVAAANGSSKDERRLYLTKIYSRDQHHTNDSQHRFEEIFSIEAINDLAFRWDVEIVEAPAGIEYEDRIAKGGWRYFYRGTGAVETLEPQDASISLPADFFRSLRPKVTGSTLFQKLAKSLFSDHSIEIAAQLRIEEDWAIFAEHHVKPSAIPGEEFHASADRIIQKIKNALSRNQETVFVSCDERYIFAPKWTISKQVKDETGIDILFKSDILNFDEFNSLRPIDASLIDFELAKLAKIFVGLTRSTFANLATFERFACSYSDRKADYAYNFPGDLCGLRTDFGRHHDPRRACA